MSKQFLSSFTATLFAVGVLAASSASATVINFDDRPLSKYTLIEDGYAGFSWENIYSMKGDTYADTGYENGTVSGTNVAFNGYGFPASFSSETPFTLVSMDVTKAWVNGITHFKGYTATGLTYQVDVYSTTETPVLAVFNWYGVTRIEISPEFDDGFGHTVMDNITVTVVPEPATYAMLLAGLGLIGFTARRKSIC